MIIVQISGTFCDFDEMFKNTWPISNFLFGESRRGHPRRHFVKVLDHFVQIGRFPKSRFHPRLVKKFGVLKEIRNNIFQLFQKEKMKDWQGQSVIFSFWNNLKMNSFLVCQFSTKIKQKTFVWWWNEIIIFCAVGSTTQHRELVVLYLDKFVGCEHSNRELSCHFQRINLQQGDFIRQVLGNLQRHTEWKFTLGFGGSVVITAAWSDF